jgi:HlyD family secretion protein
MMQWASKLWGRSILHRMLLAGPLVLVLLLAGFWQLGGARGVEYYPDTATVGDILRVVNATGTIDAVATVDVGSQVSGIISEIFVDFNAQVTRGQVIAQIDPSILRTRLLQSEADLTNAQANVRALEAALDTQRADVMGAQASLQRAQAQFREAELNYQRTIELFEQGIVAASQRDSVEAAYQGASANMRVSEAQLEQSQARLRQQQAQLEQARAQVQQRAAATQMARVDLGHTTIRAPVDGIVIARNVDPGQTVAASLQAPTLFLIAQDLTKMIVYAKTDEADVGSIRTGALAHFRVDSFPRETFRGRVTQVRMNPTTIQNVVTYDTIIEFENPEQKLFPGMTAYVTIPVAEARNVLRIPNGAIRYNQQMDPDERAALLAKHGVEDVASPNARRTGAAVAKSGNQTGAAGGGDAAARRRMAAAAAAAGGGPREQWAIVWKLAPDNQIIPARIRLGITDFTVTEVLEGSLEDGDRVVIGQSVARGQAERGPGGMSGPGGLPRRM